MGTAVDQGVCTRAGSPRPAVATLVTGIFPLLLSSPPLPPSSPSSRIIRPPVHHHIHPHDCPPNVRARWRQVKYLNQALESYDASLVVPTHYVLFTLSSIVGPSSIKGRRVMFGRMSRRRFLVPAGTFSFAKYVRSAGSFFGLALPKGTSRAPP